MPRRLLDLEEHEVQVMPLDHLASYVLQHLIEEKEWNAHNFLNHGEQQRLSSTVLRCWSEALNWLVSQNLVARGKPGSTDASSIFVTRRGLQVSEQGMSSVRGLQRLGIDLHSTLQKARSQFLIGEYELAAFAALREVEIRVRRLSGESSSLLGVKLMRKAFGDGGALVDGELDPGERVGLMELFAGAIGTFKNPPSHRQVDYGDATEASEVVLLADLLMRVLDRAEAKLGLPMR